MARHLEAEKRSILPVCEHFQPTNNIAMPTLLYRLGKLKLAGKRAIFGTFL